MSRLFAGTPFEQPVTCERCTRRLTGDSRCVCARDRLTGKVLVERDQALRIRREKRGGKMVTVVSGFVQRSDRSNDLPDMLKRLKTTLGTGGTATDTTLELQGDHRDRLVAHFVGLGYPAKPAGG